MPKEVQKNFLFEALKRLAHFEYKFEQAGTYLRNNRAELLDKFKQRIVDNLQQITLFLRNSPITSIAGCNNNRTGYHYSNLFRGLETLNLNTRLK